MRLGAFGLSGTVEAVYQAPLRNPTPAVDDLPIELNLTETDVRVSCQELTELALLRSSWDDPLTLRPVVPEVGLKVLLAQGGARATERAWPP